MICYNSFAVKRIIFFLLISCYSFSQTAEEVALQVEAKLHRLRSIQADFEQIYYPASLSNPLTEKGKFYFKKPDLMRWEYRRPEQKVFLYKRGVFLAYYPEDKELIQSSLSKEKYETEVLSLLSGQKQLTDDYLVEFNPFPSENPKAWKLKLTPREESDYSHILLEVDERNWLILKAIFLDWAGNKSEFQFSQIKADVQFPQKMFELEVPPDVEIFRDESFKK